MKMGTNRGASDFGHKPSGKSSYKICPKCGGTGTVLVKNKDISANHDAPETVLGRNNCPNCLGWGYVFDDFCI